MCHARVRESDFVDLLVMVEVSLKPPPSTTLSFVYGEGYAERLRLCNRERGAQNTVSIRPREAGVMTEL